MNKPFSISRYALLLVGIFSACNKKDAVSVNPDFNHPNNGCLLGKTSDLFVFGIYDLGLTYNAKGNPATITDLQITYDDKDRLLKKEINPDNYVQWNYRDDHSFLPASYTKYSNGVLTETLLYSYDDRGRIIQTDQIYVYPFAHGEIILQYAYDDKDNVQVILQRGQPTPVFVGRTYDDKPNSMGANQWIKYLLTDLSNGYIGLHYFLFSANNALEWSVNDNSYGFFAPSVNSYYEYNAAGFATRDSVVYHDLTNGDYYDIQINSFNCP